MSNTPRVNFDVLRNQIQMYDSSEPSVNFSLTPIEQRTDREAKYNLELELTALDFIRDELKELQRDIESRSKAVADLLDSRI